MANAELRELFEADQDDRRARRWDGLIERDAARRARATELVERGGLETADDHFHAAMLFQHGQAAEDHARAHRLAVRAAELGHPHARWLAAATLDRSLVHRGRPQKYGTQYHAVDGRWELNEVDPATTDTERAEWGVPPLEEALARAARMTRERPPTSWPV